MEYSTDETPESNIEFYCEETDFQLADENKIRTWIEKVAISESNEIGYVSFVFCSDDYLHKMNVEYLKHDTLTDIITFPYKKNPIEGDVFISIDRVADNAKDFNQTFEHELHRVIIHGILHLCGYGDKTEVQEKKMRALEEKYLGQLLADS